MKKIAFIIILGITACNYDSIVVEDPECSEVVTYEAGARDIINFSCATVGCHIIGGDGPGDYTSYRTMKGWLDDGSVEQRILTGLMPPPGSPELTAQDRESLLCWIEANYPEN